MAKTTKTKPKVKKVEESDDKCLNCGKVHKTEHSVGEGKLEGKEFQEYMNMAKKVASEEVGGFLIVGTVIPAKNDFKDVSARMFANNCSKWLIVESVLRGLKINKAELMVAIMQGKIN